MKKIAFFGKHPEKAKFALSCVKSAALSLNRRVLVIDTTYDQELISWISNCCVHGSKTTVSNITLPHVIGNAPLIEWSTTTNDKETYRFLSWSVFKYITYLDSVLKQEEDWVLYPQQYGKKQQTTFGNVYKHFMNVVHQAQVDYVLFYLSDYPGKFNKYITLSCDAYLVATFGIFDHQEIINIWLDDSAKLKTSFCADSVRPPADLVFPINNPVKLEWSMLTEQLLALICIKRYARFDDIANIQQLYLWCETCQDVFKSGDKHWCKDGEEDHVVHLAYVRNATDACERTVELLLNYDTAYGSYENNSYLECKLRTLGNVFVDISFLALYTSDPEPTSLTGILDISGAPKKIWEWYQCNVCQECCQMIKEDDLTHILNNHPCT